MKNRIIILLVTLFFGVQTGYSQTWSEWFQQKKTQRKYLMLQIAKLQIYLNFVKKGYSIVNEGLQFIGDIKSGDLAQHADYYLRLEKVNPLLRSSGKVQSIVTRQRAMSRLWEKFAAQMADWKLITESEKQYLTNVGNAVTNESADHLEELLAVVTDHAIQMSDQERVNRIEKIAGSIESNFEFLASFCEQTRKQQLQRSKELSGFQQLQKIY